MAEETKPRRAAPSLQDLVEKYGSYADITPRGRAKWDRDYAAYQEAIRLDLPWPRED